MRAEKKRARARESKRETARGPVVNDSQVTRQANYSQPNQHHHHHHHHHHHQQKQQQQKQQLHQQ